MRRSKATADNAAVRDWLLPVGILAAVVAITALLGWLISYGVIVIKFAE